MLKPSKYMYAGEAPSQKKAIPRSIHSRHHQKRTPLGIGLSAD